MKVFLCWSQKPQIHGLELRGSMARNHLPTEPNPAETSNRASSFHIRFARCWIIPHVGEICREHGLWVRPDAWAEEEVRSGCMGSPLGAHGRGGHGDSYAGRALDSRERWRSALGLEASHDTTPHGPAVFPVLHGHHRQDEPPVPGQSCPSSSVILR